MADLTVEQILDYYEEWCDERCAQFLGPDEDTVREFRLWLVEEKGVEPLDWGERAMIAEYRRQEAES